MFAATRSPDAVTAVLLETIAALEQESAVLAGRSDDSLAEVSLRKSRWISEMFDMLRSCSPAERAEHLALVARARDLNDRNARLLAARLISNRSRLDVLRGTAAATYGADGLAASLARPAGAVLA